VQKRIYRSAREVVLKDSNLVAAHVGISIFDPASGRYLFNYQGDKYFVPASNTKIPTCYAAMKYLGDSLMAARVEVKESGIMLFPSGDPSFMHPDFLNQPLLKFLKDQKKTIILNLGNWKDEHWGSGWTWNDYNAAYMAERSPFPVYGNVVHWFLSGDTLKSFPVLTRRTLGFETDLTYDLQNGTVSAKSFNLDRRIDENNFVFRGARFDFAGATIPLRTDVPTVRSLIEDVTGQDVKVDSIAYEHYRGKDKLIGLHSQPTDSLLKPMMHRSDNFFAEQTLLMVSNEQLGFMSDARIIDTLLKTDFKDLPQRPRWADGSGLSRYNLFTPQDFVAILSKMKSEFGMERIKEVFPTGGEGTLSGLYKMDSGYLYAKTGTLSGVVALSGFLYTKSNRLLIFSVLVNNHQGSAPGVRRAVELFIQGVRNKY
jgi:D-alanyl-D-alanine carboxypeptidase/D-alanyl-D-alanine-endopeptidase (penicillin-binding protein 4)